MKSIFFIFLTTCINFVVSKTSSPLPVVIWHGMGDSCCNPLSMGKVVKIIENEIPDVYVKSLMLGDNVITDTEHGFFADMNDLVSDACAQIQSDEKLKNGYHAIGFSQGGLFLRAVAQRCPNPPIHNLVSIGGPQQGIFGLPFCPGSTTICNTVRYLLDLGAYVSFVQNRLVQAQYWHDPNDPQNYKADSIFLADINNENTANASYKENLVKIKNLVLVMFLQDEMVIPKESEWFGFYPDHNTSYVLDVKQTALYQEDRIGIKQLKESNRLKFITIDGQHLQISKEELIDQIIKPYFSPK